jgi:hypothetical protein
MSVGIDLHRVTKVVINDTRRNVSDIRTYDTRTITIHHHDGKTTYLTMFSVDVEDEDNLPLSFSV